METKRLVDIASLPPDAEIAPEWDALLASLGRPASQTRIKALMESGFHTFGDVAWASWGEKPNLTPSWSGRTVARALHSGFRRLNLHEIEVDRLRAARDTRDPMSRNR